MGVGERCWCCLSHVKRFIIKVTITKFNTSNIFDGSELEKHVFFQYDRLYIQGYVHLSDDPHKLTFYNKLLHQYAIDKFQKYYFLLKQLQCKSKKALGSHNKRYTNPPLLLLYPNSLYLKHILNIPLPPLYPKKIHVFLYTHR